MGHTMFPSFCRNTRTLGAGVGDMPRFWAHACTRALLLVSGLAACTGSPATLALQPDFEVMTPAGIASVSVRQPLPGMTDAQFTQLVTTGMHRVARDNVTPGGVGSPTP